MQARRDNAEYEDALNELLTLTNAKAKLAIMRTHSKMIEHLLGAKMDKLDLIVALIAFAYVIVLSASLWRKRK